VDRLEPAKPDAVRGIIAREWLREEIVPREVGSVRLRPHQLDAAKRIRGIVQRTGGALLCDEVGLGKTYVALAIATSYARPLVVAPAALRAMWLDASDRAGVTIRFVSIQSLSRTLSAARDHDFIIVDEAHHFRTRSTARYRALTWLAARAPILLVSATPLHNKAADLIALIELFLGSAARGLATEQVAGLVVRRPQREAAELFPRVRKPVRLQLPSDAQMLDALLALPPPIPPRDGGTAAAMVTHTLIRLWASSDAALREGLRKRLARAVAIRQALEAGHYPTRQELAAWTYGEGSVQLGFAELLAPEQFAASSALLDAVNEHERKLRELLGILPPSSRADVARVEHLRALRLKHTGARIVAFSQYSETVAMYYRHLARAGGTAMLTARGGRIASGAITRTATLERFAPNALGVLPPTPCQEISLLITTDLLSEGVNLQDSSVIVHLDLPWTAATLEQRVGRVARLGSHCRDVFVYHIAPPAASARLLRAELIIRRKTALSDAGVGASSIPPLFARARTPPRSSVADAELVRKTLETWADRSTPNETNRTLWAAVTANRDATLALVSIRGRRILLVHERGRLSTAPDRVLEIAQLANGERTTIHPGEIRRVHERTCQWLDDALASEDAGQTISGSTVLARRIAARLARLLAACPGHLRPRLSERIAALQQRIQAPLSLGMEQEIAAALQFPVTDLVGELEQIISPEAMAMQDTETGVRAILILRRASSETKGVSSSFLDGRDQRLDRRLPVAEIHESVVGREQRIRNPRKSGTERSLHHDHAPRVVHLEDRHPRDR